MPKDLPDPAALWEGNVSFFSLDTDLIQSAGYNFSGGALNQLPAQLPTGMGIALSEVVVQEVINHRLEPVRKAMAQFQGASNDLARTAGLDMKDVDAQFAALKAVDFARDRYRQEIEQYVERCRGVILPIRGDDLAARVFDRYFTQSPPFAKSAAKKAEFPDATTLLLLEEHAVSEEAMGIFASRDGGVEDYAASSERIFCVKSIEDLAALFAAVSEHAQLLKNRVKEALEDELSTVRNQLRDSVADHVSDAEWEVGDIYTGSAYRVEGEAHGAELEEYEVLADLTSVWESTEEPGLWIIEVTVAVKAAVSLDVTFYAWDSIDREELELNIQTVVAPAEFSLDVYLTCSGIDLENPDIAWDVEIDIGNGRYTVDVGEVDLDFDAE